ncbi:MAG: DUF1385 domain-containing protein [Christensenellales bacterium]
MIAISFVPDIKRVFMYHGAEHKTVYCNEAGLELTPENARQFSRLHPRCGTGVPVSRHVHLDSHRRGGGSDSLCAVRH